MKKENCNWNYIILWACLWLLFSYSCQKDDSDNNTNAVSAMVTTSAVTDITQTTASVDGNITNDGGATITARGICWSTTQNPTIVNNRTTDGSGTGAFTGILTGLTANTTYFVRAYATSDKDTTYGNEVSFTTKQEPAGNSVKDIDGNSYGTITIGTQTWMVQNLRTTKYNDGTTIPLITDNNAWVSDSLGAYSWYENDPAKYKTAYGGLYNWYAVNTGKLCPPGWHVPTDNDWKILTDYLGGETIAGGKLKETGFDHWSSPNTNADNSTGFTALPGGSRYYKDASFNRNGLDGYWWSSSDNTIVDAWGRNISFYHGYLYRNLPWDKQWGFSVRCVKD